MHTLSKKIQQGGKYSAQIESRQADFRIVEKSIDKKSWSISDLQIDYLNLENSVGYNERENFLDQGSVTVEVHT